MFYFLFGIIYAQSCIKRDDHTYTGNYHFQYANWEEMAKVKVNKMLKSGKTIEDYRRWMKTTHREPSVHYIKDFDMKKVENKLQVVTGIGVYLLTGYLLVFKNYRKICKSSEKRVKLGH